MWEEGLDTRASYSMGKGGIPGGASLAKIGVAIVAVELERMGAEGRYLEAMGRKAEIDRYEVGRILGGTILILLKVVVTCALGGSCEGRDVGFPEPRIFAPLCPTALARADRVRSRVRPQRGPPSSEGFGISSVLAARAEQNDFCVRVETDFETFSKT